MEKREKWLKGEISRQAELHLVILWLMRIIYIDFTFSQLVTTRHFRVEITNPIFGNSFSSGQLTISNLERILSR
ncbi:hypothetical protein M5689_007087 [Euphorbia peplus]|nr:hypothetical protein M5689_007087 [Euphorbia peplus]